MPTTNGVKTLKAETVWMSTDGIKINSADASNICPPGTSTMQIKIKKYLYIHCYSVPKEHRYLVVRRGSADCPSGNINMQMTSDIEHGWNDTVTRKNEALAEEPSQVEICPPENLKWNGLGTKPDPRGDSPTTSRLKHGTSIKMQFGLNNKYHLSSCLRQQSVSLRKTN
jgi:hypothetical protein